MLVLLDDSFKAKAMIASRSDVIKEFVEPPYLRARQFFCLVLVMVMSGSMNSNQAVFRLCQAPNFSTGRSHSLLFFSSFKPHCKSVVRVSVILQLIRSSFVIT